MSGAGRPRVDSTGRGSMAWRLSFREDGRGPRGPVRYFDVSSLLSEKQLPRAPAGARAPARSSASEPRARRPARPIERVRASRTPARPPDRARPSLAHPGPPRGRPLHRARPRCARARLDRSVPDRDRHADHAPPLRPGTVVVPGRGSEHLVQHEPGVGTALADPAVGDRRQLELDAAGGEPLAEGGVPEDPSVGADESLPRKADRGWDVPRALGGLVPVPRLAEHLA